MFPIAMSIVMTTLGLVCLGISILGMPGNWLLLLMSVIAALSFHSESISHIPWWGVGVMLAFALLGEGLELLAGALGVGKLGGSKRSAALAVVGSVVGAIVGLFVGLPIPVVGSLIASVVFGGIGACVGAVFGERWKGKDWDGSMQIGVAAFWGKLLGTAGKVVCGAAMLVVFLFTIWT